MTVTLAPSALALAFLSVIPAPGSPASLLAGMGENLRLPRHSEAPLP